MVFWEFRLIVWLYSFIVEENLFVVLLLKVRCYYEYKNVSVV